VIQFRGVNKWFGPLHVLKDIDLAVNVGEVVVVCGPSGSGKSTLIRCINKLEPIQKGEIVVDNMSLSDPATDITKLRAEVGMVFQQFNLYPHMTALQNITLAPVKVRRQSREEAERIARDLLVKVGIPEKADNYPAQLSGGQQQRVAIAWPCSPRSCSLMSRPRPWIRR
jgi:polar amino acid transport system ATP-binding protein